LPELSFHVRERLPFRSYQLKISIPESTLRVSGISTRDQGRGRLDAGALHRQRRCREYFGAVTLEDRVKPLLKK
jgi:hypothetical protein